LVCLSVCPSLTFGSTISPERNLTQTSHLVGMFTSWDNTTSGQRGQRSRSHGPIEFSNLRSIVITDI